MLHGGDVFSGGHWTLLLMTSDLHLCYIVVSCLIGFSCIVEYSCVCVCVCVCVHVCMCVVCATRLHLEHPGHDGNWEKKLYMYKSCSHKSATLGFHTKT